MATRIRRGTRRLHLYITEWREQRGLSVEQLAGRIEPPVDQSTVWRWETQQHRLNPDKIAQIAAALDLEPRELWRRPNTAEHPSIDQVLHGADDSVREAVHELARRLIGRRS